MFALSLRLLSGKGVCSFTGVTTSICRLCSSTPPGACVSLTTCPSISTTLSSPASLSTSGATSVSLSATACTVPQPSRSTRKLMPPSCRFDCSQPATRTRAPTCWPTSVVGIRFINPVPFLFQKQKPSSRWRTRAQRLSWYHHHSPTRRLENVSSGAQGLYRLNPYLQRVNRRATTGASRSQLLCPTRKVHRLAQGCHQVGRRQCSQHPHCSLRTGNTLNLSLSSPFSIHLLNSTIA